MEQLSISSFLHNGHPFHLYAYNDIQNVPAGVVLKDASEVVHPARIFKYKDHDSYAGFSNLFRYKLLLEKGGYWVDTDVVCLQPFAAEPDYVFASENVRYSLYGLLKKPYTTTSCVLKAPSGSGIFDYCCCEAEKRNPQDLTWGEIGPGLVSTAVEKYGMQSWVEKAETFCPIDWWHWKKSINNSPLLRGEENRKIASANCRAVHLWNEMWRRNGVDKNADFPANSIYEFLKRRYFVYSSKAVK